MMENKINEYKEGFRNYADHTPAGAKIVFNMICKEYERTIKEQQKDLDFFLKRQEVNKQITQELTSLNDPRVAAILNKVRTF